MRSVVILSGLLALARQVHAQAMMPSYALEYAPLLFLYPNETNWPTNLTSFLSHLQAEDEYTPIPNAPSPLTGNNLNESVIDLPTTYLTSIDNPATSPQADWLISLDGKPNAAGFSISPSTIILVNKTGMSNISPAGDLDVFYFALYAFNLGPYVDLLQENFGNHVGDLEFMMVRYLNGEPQAVFYSEHDDGAAWTYSAVSKNGSRPISYIALGSHANYPTTGKQYYENDLIYDLTGMGPMWDPTLNWQAYWYTQSNNGFTPVSDNPNQSQDTSWLNFMGTFGDKQYNSSNPLQQNVLGEYKWGDGFSSIANHTLVRNNMCATTACSPQTSLPQTSVLQDIAEGILGDLGVSR